MSCLWDLKKLYKTKIMEHSNIIWEGGDWSERFYVSHELSRDFFQFYWNIIDCNIVYVWSVWCEDLVMYILQNYITLRLVNIFIPSHNYIFFVKKKFKVYSLKNFLVYNTVLPTIVTTVCIRPQMNKYEYSPS